MNSLIIHQLKIISLTLALKPRNMDLFDIRMGKFFFEHTDILHSCLEVISYYPFYLFPLKSNTIPQSYPHAIYQDPMIIERDSLEWNYFRYHIHDNTSNIKTFTTALKPVSILTPQITKTVSISYDILSNINPLLEAGNSFNISCGLLEYNVFTKLCCEIYTDLVNVLIQADFAYSTDETIPSYIEFKVTVLVNKIEVNVETLKFTVLEQPVSDGISLGNHLYNFQNSNFCKVGVIDVLKFEQILSPQVLMFSVRPSFNLEDLNQLIPTVYFAKT